MSEIVPRQFKGLGQGGMNTDGGGTSSNNDGTNGNPSSQFVPPDWAPSAKHPTPPAVTWTDLFNIYHTITQIGASMNAITAHFSGLKTSDEGLKGIAKFKEPKPFDGKASSITQFLQDIRNAIQLSYCSLVSDHNKCLYFSTYLESGTLKEWYNSVELNNRELLDDFEKFAESFKKHFGDSNIVATAQNKLDKLYQTGSAAQYIAWFNEWVIHLNLTDTSKIHMLYRHLKMSVKDTVTFIPKAARPVKFKEYCDFITEINNRLHECN
ncbi:hypothetical protein Moror_14565 [Moniliophthora roreri MCA 2997]|uniref:Retrotransposon gag domain-containing protein n=2 Tax=Moniliophthora roreri TaxID=221103 RepID=V2XK98_MONRO|nr:hypothetical protein Moror_14565 [Moniliophthora roreri MCA 2997]KAI3611993.1 hypothetical protein WG66_016314 [Moniliophthora roreri]KAI3620014.1 hypothetical protein WG66_009066 [Moniliophthora roreri]